MRSVRGAERETVALLSHIFVLNGIISHRSCVTSLASVCKRILRLLDLSPLTAVWFAGCQVSGHQRLLFPAFLCTGHPHAQTVPAEGSARRHADEQNAASPGEGGFHHARADGGVVAPGSCVAGQCRHEQMHWLLFLQSEGF